MLKTTLRIIRIVCFLGVCLFGLVLVGWLILFFWFFFGGGGSSRDFYVTIFDEGYARHARPLYREGPSATLTVTPNIRFKITTKDTWHTLLLPRHLTSWVYRERESNIRPSACKANVLINRAAAATNEIAINLGLTIQAFLNQNKLRPVCSIQVESISDALNLKYPVNLWKRKIWNTM